MRLQTGEARVGFPAGFPLVGSFSLSLSLFFSRFFTSPSSLKRHRSARFRKRRCRAEGGWGSKKTKAQFGKQGTVYFRRSHLASARPQRHVHTGNGLCGFALGLGPARRVILPQGLSNHRTHGSRDGLVPVVGTPPFYAVRRFHVRFRGASRRFETPCRPSADARAPPPPPPPPPGGVPRAYRSSLWRDRPSRVAPSNAPYLGVVMMCA